MRIRQDERRHEENFLANHQFRIRLRRVDDQKLQMKGCILKQSSLNYDRWNNSKVKNKYI